MMAITHAGICSRRRSCRKERAPHSGGCNRAELAFRRADLMRPQPARKRNAGCVECMNKKKSTVNSFAVCPGFELPTWLPNISPAIMQPKIIYTNRHQTCTIHICDKSRGGHGGWRVVGGAGSVLALSQEESSQHSELQWPWPVQVV